MLRSSLSQKSIKVEIILVDNGSSPKHVQIIKRKFPQIKIIGLPKNVGYAKAVNLGAMNATGKNLFFTNNDCKLASNCLNNLVMYLKTNPQVVIVGPVSYKDQQMLQIDSAIQKISLTSGLIKTHPSTNPSVSDWISGSGLMISKKNFIKLGGFDERFFFYYEDVDLCLRAQKLGKVICLPSAIMYHERGSTAFSIHKRDQSLYYLHKAKQQLVLKHGTIVQIFVNIFLQLVVFNLYHLLILRDHSILPMIKATLDNIYCKEK